MKRRAFFAVLSGVAAWPFVGHAEQPARVRRVGVLMPYAENDPITRAFVTAFAQALERFEWVEGKNIRIDHRFASGDPALFKTYAAELVGLGRNSRKQPAGGRGVAGADAHDTDRFRRRGRSRRYGLCSKPRATRRQHHGVQRQ